MASAWLKKVDCLCVSNNLLHHTDQISDDQLIVRRGQPFSLKVDLNEPLNMTPLFIQAVTGQHGTEEQGTMCYLSVPDVGQRSPKAKAVWKVDLDHKSSPTTGNLILIFTPPADAPIGKYTMVASYKGSEELLANPTVLFNPWCPEDWVFLKDEKERNEYVMNEHGVIFVGTSHYPFPRFWDYGQFDDSMTTICISLLDQNHKHKVDPGDDVSARCNPIYVSRVISAMINCNDDNGVLWGKWSTPYSDGVSPSHWTGSNTILTKWFESGFHPVKYGQCWVFAAVMCSAMRLLGIPSRVVTNFNSAHDNNANLTIDRYHYEEDYIDEVESDDSIWNFHVWVESWMRRPDLSQDGTFDGWQVLDPTPQEMSDGVYCCGPASTKAILNGNTDRKYDVPFVFAEVNADVVTWLVKVDGSHEKIECDTSHVGHQISTKAVGSDDRDDITITYKHYEGTLKERAAFKKAKHNIKLENETIIETDADIPPPPKVSMRFEEVSQPRKGEDVSLKLVLSSESTEDRPLVIKINVHALKYNGSSALKIQSEVKEETLQPNKELSVTVLIPFSVYWKPMLDCESMNISALVRDKENADHPYMAEDNIVLLDPPVEVSLSGDPKKNYPLKAEIAFLNPVNETLQNCCLTISGSGLVRGEMVVNLGDIKPSRRKRVSFQLFPYKLGKKTLMADFDCSIFRDIKASCTVTVKS